MPKEKQQRWSAAEKRHHLITFLLEVFDVIDLHVCDNGVDVDGQAQPRPPRPRTRPGPKDEREGFQPQHRLGLPLAQPPRWASACGIVGRDCRGPLNWASSVHGRLQLSQQPHSRIHQGRNGPQYPVRKPLAPRSWAHQQMCQAQEAPRRLDLWLHNALDTKTGSPQLRCNTRTRDR